MEHRFKLQISKILQSAFNTCRPKNISDVSNNHPFFPKTSHHRRLIDLFSPKPQPISSSSCNPEPRLSQLGTSHPVNADRQGPPSVSPLHEKTTKRGRKKRPQYRKRKNSASFSSITDNYYYNWWSSDEDDQSDGKTTLFSRRSVSSDSLESNHKNRAKRSGGGGGRRDGRATDVVAVDGIAVAKESSDPYEDFRVSMVDMIVEKGIFGVEDLEKLVDCFLSLNSEEHHKVIFEVFAEIWETLISDLYERE